MVAVQTQRSKVVSTKQRFHLLAACHSSRLHLASAPALHHALAAHRRRSLPSIAQYHRRMYEMLYSALQLTAEVLGTGVFKTILHTFRILWVGGFGRAQKGLQRDKSRFQCKDGRPGIFEYVWEELSSCNKRKKILTYLSRWRQRPKRHSDDTLSCTLMSMMRTNRDTQHT